MYEFDDTGCPRTTRSSKMFLKGFTAMTTLPTLLYIRPRSHRERSSLQMLATSSEAGI